MFILIVVAMRFVIAFIKTILCYVIFRSFLAKACKEDISRNTVKIDPFPLSAFVSIGPYTLPPLSANVTKYTVNSDSWTSSNHQMSVSDCCWHWQDTVLAAGCQQVLSIYLLPIPRTPQFTCCKL